MVREYDDIVLDYWRLPNVIYFVKMKIDDGLEGHDDVKLTLPSHLGAFNLSNGKRITNDFIKEKKGFYVKIIYYTDMDSLYTAKRILGCNR